MIREFPTITEMAPNIHLLSCTVCLCEAVFSPPTIVKSKYWSTLKINEDAWFPKSNIQEGLILYEKTEQRINLIRVQIGFQLYHACRKTTIYIPTGHKIKRCVLIYLNHQAWNTLSACFQKQQQKDNSGLKRRLREKSVCCTNMKFE